MVPQVDTVLTSQSMQANINFCRKIGEDNLIFFANASIFIIVQYVHYLSIMYLHIQQYSGHITGKSHGPGCPSFFSAQEAEHMHLQLKTVPSVLPHANCSEQHLWIKMLKNGKLTCECMYSTVSSTHTVPLGQH